MRQALEEHQEARGPARIARPLLAAKIVAACEAGPLLLVAGAGYGKSAALEEGLRDGGRLVWINCSAAEREAGRLLAQLVESLHSVVPGVADPLAEVLATATEQVDAVSAAQGLAADLERLLIEPLVIVIDDAEQLEDAPAAIEILQTLLTRRAPALRVVVAGRRPLPLRLGKLRAAGRLTELGRADLVFSGSECAALLQRHAGEEAAHDEVEAVMQATEGWPLGVALAASAERRSQRTFASHDTLFAYFAEELLEDLEAPLREAVIDSSVVSELAPAMLPVFGLPGDFAARAERIGLLLAPSGKQDSLRYHPLLRQFLLDRVERERSAEQMRDLHSRAARALSEDGRGGEAIEHWLAAEDGAQAAAAIARDGPALARTAPESARGWLDALPPDARLDPGVKLLEGTLATLAGRHDRGIAALAAAVEGHHARGDVPSEWFARLALADALFFTGGFEQMVPLAEGFDAEEAQATGPIPMVTALYAAVGLAQIGRPEASRTLAARAVAGGDPAGLLTPLELIHAAYTDAPAGAIDDVHRRMEAAIARLERAGDPTGRLSYLFAGFAQLLEEEGFDERALQWWERAFERGSHEGLGGWIGTLKHTFAAVSHARAGRRDEAELALTAIADAELGGWQGAWIEAARGAVAGLRGQSSEAIDHAERAWQLSSRAPIAYQVWMATTLGEVLVEAGQQARARVMVDETLTLLDRRLPGEHGRFWRARLVAIRSWLLAADGDERAMEELRRAWHEAGACAVHLVRRDWRWLERLLWSALEEGILDADEVLRAVAAARPEGRDLVAFTGHPAARVRIAAIGPAVASGNPEAIGRLEPMKGDPDARVASAARAAAERVSHTRPPLVFRLLGSFSARRGTWPIEQQAWGRPMAARLIRYMLIHREGPVPEDLLFEALWPDKPASAARRSLQVAVSSVRGVLDLPGDESSALERVGESYLLRLRTEDLVDVDEFDAATAAALAEKGPKRVQLLERADALWSSEPLPEDRYADWSVAWRERLLDRYTELLAALAECYRQVGDHHATIHAARRSVLLDPLNESGHRELMGAYARAGRTGHALRQYLECRRALVDELGVEPAAATSRMHAKILAGEAV